MRTPSSKTSSYALRHSQATGIKLVVIGTADEQATFLALLSVSDFASSEEDCLQNFRALGTMLLH